jgi:LmbE family N-acetylglucosaminyl deacetylase
MSGHDVVFPRADLGYRLRGLGMGGAVLHVGAHPDDEEAGLIAYLSRGLGVRTVYWSATRGEGGQNRVGPERGESLGILRTWESLDARALDGGEVLYGPFYDFGFSRSGEDCLARWGRDGVAQEISRAIRFVQPDVVVSRWTGRPQDGHGQHQAIGLVVDEAIDAAADGSRFPELDLPPWRAGKLYRSAVGDWQPGEDVTFGHPVPELEAESLLRINTGVMDPISGRSYQELAWIGVNRHQTQGMAFVPTPGDHFAYYRLDRSPAPPRIPEEGFLDGLDPTLPGVADHLDREPAGLRGFLEEARNHALAAASAFRPEHPADAGRSVLAGLASLRKARRALDEGGGDDDRRAVRRYLERKVRAFEDVAARCLGLDLRCLVDESRLTPGRRLQVRAQLWMDPGIAVDEVEVRLEVPDAWDARQVDPQRADGSGKVPLVTSAAYEVRVPENAELSCPYWLREPAGPYRYAWPDDGPLGLPFDGPLISATCEVRLGSDRLSVSRPAGLRETYAGGFRELGPQVVPPVSLRPRERRKLLPMRDEPERVELQLAARSMRDRVQGRLAIEVPEGWQVHPEEVDVSFERAGAVRTPRFEVTIPADAKPGVHELGYRISSGQRDFRVVSQPVWRRPPGLAGPTDEATAVEEIFVMAPATVSLHLIESRFVSRLRHAYIPGADEEILGSLAHFGLDMAVLSPEELSYADLTLFDAIVVGPNAYVVSDAVRRNAGRLLEYAERGGTLIVQYQGYGYERQGLAPYPFRYRQPHDRVTVPDAPVTLLRPDHPILTTPNRITAEDFDGWVHDRGLYFFGDWDKRYIPLMETTDPGQEPQRGCLLVASYGRGTFLYSGLSFFRQIPEGVPGAIRLFANLLGFAEARILERVEWVRHVPVFSFMTDAQLYEVSRLMSERWLDPGTELCRQGERGSELFMILDGEVEVIKVGDAESKLIHVAGTGEVVGELAVLTDLPRSATLRAQGDVKVLVMRGTHFREFLRRHTDLSERMMSLLAERLSSSEILW